VAKATTREPIDKREGACFTAAGEGGEAMAGGGKQ
jgi:hypothetical protein